MATLLSIRTEARIRADHDRSTFPTDAQYNTLIERSASAVYRQLIRAGWVPNEVIVSITANGAGFYNVSTTGTTVVLGVFRVQGTQLFPLRRLDPEELAALRELTGDAEGYVLEGGANDTLTIQLYPKPSSGSYRVTHQPRFGGFPGGDTDPWYGPDGSEELVALGAAIRAVKKEGDDQMAALLRDEYDVLFAEISEVAGWLHGTQPQRIRDALGRRGRLDPADYRAGEGWDG